MYLLDEIVSHKIMFTTLFVIYSLIALLDVKKSNRMDVLLGIVLGFSQGAMWLEGQSVIEMIFLSIIFILYSLVKKKWRKSFGLIFFVACLTSLTGLMFYWFYMKGFPQPSEIL